MREAGITGVSRRKKHGYARRNPRRESYPYLVFREFGASAPNRLWVADMTEHATRQGWLYLAVTMDIFSRMVVGSSMEVEATTELMLNALNMAIRNRCPGEALTHHSD